MKTGYENRRISELGRVVAECQTQVSKASEVSKELIQFRQSPNKVSDCCQEMHANSGGIFRFTDSRPLRWSNKRCSVTKRHKFNDFFLFFSQVLCTACHSKVIVKSIARDFAFFNDHLILISILLLLLCFVFRSLSFARAVSGARERCVNVFAH